MLEKKIEDELPDNYVKILENKNKNIFKPDYSSEFKKYDLFSGVFFGQNQLDDILDNPDYLNR